MFESIYRLTHYFLRAYVVNVVHDIVRFDVVVIGVFSGYYPKSREGILKT